MSRIEHLRDQAERAERLAKAIMDTLTVERLRAFAAECQSQVDTLSTSKEASKEENAAA